MLATSVQHENDVYKGGRALQQESIANFSFTRIKGCECNSGNCFWQHVSNLVVVTTECGANEVSRADLVQCTSQLRHNRL